jgi:hypothetical protein
VQNARYCGIFNDFPSFLTVLQETHIVKDIIWHQTPPPAWFYHQYMTSYGPSDLSAAQRCRKIDLQILPRRFPLRFYIAWTLLLLIFKFLLCFSYELCRMEEKRVHDEKQKKNN